MPQMPVKLEELVELFRSIPERTERIEALVSIADRFRPVPEEIARRPFPEEHRVKHCESEAFVWAQERGDGTLDFFFAVENPQGITAMATAVILSETLSGARPDLVAAVPWNVIYEFFGRELSMGKSMGLMGMVDMVRSLALQSLADRSGAGTARP
jgi:cysteine desulfuration protein SufE